MPGHQSMKTCDNAAKVGLWNCVGRSSSFICGLARVAIKMVTPTSQIAPRLWSERLQAWREIPEKNCLERDCQRCVHPYYSSNLYGPVQHPTLASSARAHLQHNKCWCKGFGQVFQESSWLLNLRCCRRGWLWGSNKHSPSTYQAVLKHLQLGS